MKKIKLKLERIRLLAALAAVVVIIAGLAARLDWGTFCSYCPMGFLGVTLASKNVPTGMLLSVVLVLLAAIVLGKFFCSWFCPTALLRGVFKGENSTGCDLNNCNGKSQLLSASDAISIKNNGKGNAYISMAVFGGALLASFIFGFPVFCLICPIGLFFGFIFSIYRVSTIYQPGLELLVFPLMLALEIFVLRSWCTAVCPLGAIFKLFGSLGSFKNIVLRPVVDTEACLHAKGINCRECEKICPEHIELPLVDKSKLNDCTLCLECYNKCPAKAIKVK